MRLEMIYSIFLTPTTEHPSRHQPESSTRAKENEACSTLLAVARPKKKTRAPSPPRKGPLSHPARKSHASEVLH